MHDLWFLEYIAGFLFEGESHSELLGFVGQMFFVSKKHHLLLFRMYSLQKAPLRHFCQLKADFYVDFKG